MDDTYSENRSYWANSEPKQQVSKPGSKVLGEAQHEKETGIDQDSFEPLRLTFDSPAATQKASSGQHPAFITASLQHSDTSLGKALDDATPTASLVGGVQTPDLPEHLAEHAGSQVLRAITIQASFFLDQPTVPGSVTESKLPTATTPAAVAAHDMMLAGLMSRSA